VSRVSAEEYVGQASPQFVREALRSSGQVHGLVNMLDKMPIVGQSGGVDMVVTDSVAGNAVEGHHFRTAFCRDQF